MTDLQISVVFFLIFPSLWDIARQSFDVMQAYDLCKISAKAF